MNTNNKIKITIVEDDQYFNELLTKYIKSVCTSSILNKSDLEIKSFYSAQDCIEQLEDDTDIMILDYYLKNENDDEELNGENVLNEVKKFCKDCKVIMISGQNDPGLVANLMKNGIYDYVDKNTNTPNRVGSLVYKILKNELNEKTHKSNN